MSKITTRTLAAQISYAVVYKQTNLSDAFSQRLTDKNSEELKSSVKALSYQTVRHYLYLQDLWLQCLDKLPKDKLLRVILTQALAELIYLDKPKHVVVNEAINTAKKLHKKWASGLINSSLRAAIKLNQAQEYTFTNDVARYAHPQWWIDKLKSDWPKDWQQLLAANNQKPPLWVRSSGGYSNEAQNPVHEYLPAAVKLTAQDIRSNAAFKAGQISVQDASAQLAAHIIDPQDNEKILDACAAPGGKTCHLLELNKSIKLDAIELFPNRAKKIKQNLQRLNLQANVLVADACESGWFVQPKYQKILLDAPCSASGIVRRHPDIKFLRQPQELAKICADQQKLLSHLAELVGSGGKLLYATCSVFNEENSAQIKLFLQTHPEFSEIELKYPFAVNCEYGVQILTGVEDMDGFYYCYLKKNET
ncbi:MAG TPA: 16S rRNA (cytosine(967)-C(5))-methyltransferase RsmB [Oceanospirillales bacterium]|nr:16S rRNA (cytosine(967)-C(5))-methyltransferase RsmB [Oceanospirillales bacterium]